MDVEITIQTEADAQARPDLAAVSNPGILGASAWTERSLRSSSSLCRLSLHSRSSVGHVANGSAMDREQP